MIKIEIPDLDTQKSNFVHSVKPLIQKRVESLILSINHISGDVIDLSKGDFNQYKFITRKIINEFYPIGSIKKSEFSKIKYDQTVSNCLTIKLFTKRLESLKLKGILALLNSLIANNCNLLIDLLICDAKDLKFKNENFLNQYKIDDDSSKFILQQAFDYEAADIGKAIKGFFRVNNFVDFCPYCNLTEVKYIETDGGNTASAHQLDHFFDKANNPLLACSFFNLVPSHDICNGKINKGSIPFSDKYHLNPHIRGFDNNIKFQPVLQGKKVSEITISIKAIKGSTIRKQIFGSSEKVFEDDKGTDEHKEGNVNVFKLFSKYRDRAESADVILSNVHKTDNGKRAILNLLNKMNLIDSTETYKRWYKNEVRTPFERNNFNKKAYSKFNRDIHDFYYEQDRNTRNNYIRDIINQ